MSFPDFPKKHVSGVLIHPYYYERKEIEAWKKEHEKLDAERDREYKVLEENYRRLHQLFTNEAKKRLKLRSEVREFLEWFESIPDIMDYMEEGSHPYEEKKKGLLGK